jgi:hypothetical protein
LLKVAPAEKARAVLDAIRVPWPAFQIRPTGQAQ